MLESCNHEHSALESAITALDTPDVTPTTLDMAIATLHSTIGRLHDVDMPCEVARINPLTDPAKFRSAFRSAGIVVVPAAVPEGTCHYAVHRVRDMVRSLSPGFDLASPASWLKMPTDANGTELMSRGFLDLFHDDGLARIRQSPTLYAAHALLWGTPYLSTSFDRLVVKLPGRTGYAPLPLHVDQNPCIAPDFSSTQGIVALVDNPPETGTLQVVPGSHRYFRRWSHAGQGCGDYIALATSGIASAYSYLYDNAVAVPLCAGDAVIWDSRLVHAATAPAPTLTAEHFDPIARGARLGALVSMAPAVTDARSCTDRRRLFVTASGANIRSARCHASFRPRYSDDAARDAARRTEQLSALGMALYDSTLWPTP